GDSGLSSEYRLDLRDLAYTDPNLLLFEPAGEIVPTGQAHSRALAVDAQGALHVAGDSAIKVFERGGAVRMVALPVEPRCLVVTADRYIVGCADHVLELDLDGHVLKTWASLGETALITGLAVDEDYVFIADARQRTVWCYDREGTLIRRIGDRDTARKILGFNVPSPYFDLALAPGGRLCVVNPGNHRIETYTVEGDLEAWWGEFGTTIEGFTGCCNPSSFTILSDGRFVTCEKGLVRVKLYKADGTFAGVVAGADQLVEGTPVICELPEQCQTGGFDVAADRDGRVYVLDTVKNLIRTYIEKKG
ncbi:hypothetical protein ACFL6U_32135, partial [Planctomycetota bacterium]